MWVSGLSWKFLPPSFLNNSVCLSHWLFSEVKLTLLLEESFRFNFFSHMLSVPSGLCQGMFRYFCRLEEVLVHLHGAVQLLLQMEEEVVATPKAERCLTVLEPMVLPMLLQLLRIMDTKRPLTARLGVKDLQQVWKVIYKYTRWLKITEKVSYDNIASEASYVSCIHFINW